MSPERGVTTGADPSSGREADLGRGLDPDRGITAADRATDGRRPREEHQVHTRLMKCTLEVDSARAWWRHATPGEPARAQEVFERFWFGSKSLPRVEVLVANLRARFDAFPEALEVLHRWRDMDGQTRTLVCHWHLQLSDPLYRAFTGVYLPERLDSHRPEVTRDLVVGWVSDHGPGRWTMATRVQFASKLLSSAHGAGLVKGTRDPRALLLPRVPDDALTYLLYLLRGVQFDGTLLANPYLASVGVGEDRLRALSSVRLRRQGSLVDLEWIWPDLRAWAEATVLQTRAT